MEYGILGAKRNDYRSRRCGTNHGIAPKELSAWADGGIDLEWNRSSYAILVTVPSSRFVAWARSVKHADGTNNPIHIIYGCVRG